MIQNNIIILFFYDVKFGLIDSVVWDIYSSELVFSFKIYFYWLVFLIDLIKGMLLLINVMYVCIL